MDKTKSKKTKTIQITYPAPYSHSWNADASPVLMKTTLGRSANFFKCPKRSTGPRAWSQSYSTVRGPDPTAPHLKYGVFPNRRVSSSRTLQKNMALKPVHGPQGLNLNLQAKQMSQELSSNKSSLVNKKKQQRKPQISESPVFVFRTVDKRYTRQLSSSEVMHVDIKPKRFSLISPSFCPSPNFKVMSPRLTISPNIPPRR